MPLPTLADLKTHLNATGTADDSEMQSMLDAAVDVVEGIAGPITPASVTETHYGVGGWSVVLRRAPVVSLTTVSTRPPYSSAYSDQLLTDYLVDADTGEMRRVDGLPLRGDVTVVYMAGRSVVPVSVSLAILIVAAHLWETQRGAGPSPIPGQPDPGEAFVPGIGYAIPNRARELLNGYIFPSVA